MNEPFNAIGTAPPPRPRGASPWTALAGAVLGPNEDLLLPLFTPYTPRVNLLPRPKPPSWWVLGGAGLAVTAVVLVAFALSLGWLSRQTADEIEAVKHLTTTRQAAEGRYRVLQSQVEAIDAQKGAYEFVATGAPKWSEILDRLRSLMPEGVRFDKIEGTHDGLIVITGKAENLRAVGQFMLNLRGSGTFYEPRLGMGDRTLENGQPLVKYDLQVRFAHGEWLANPEFTAATPSRDASGSAAP
ncbi:MAG TPA: PilN domain-containing protein [Stenomitos sp.]